MQDKPTQDEPAKALLILPAELGMQNVHDIKAECDQLLAVSDPVHIDAAQLIRVDTAAVQLLYALAKQLAEQKRKLIWLSVPHVLQQAADVLGVSKAMGLAATAHV